MDWIMFVLGIALLIGLIVFAVMNFLAPLISLIAGFNVYNMHSPTTACSANNLPGIVLLLIGLCMMAGFICLIFGTPVGVIAYIVGGFQRLRDKPTGAFRVGTIALVLAVVGLLVGGLILRVFHDLGCL